MTNIHKSYINGVWTKPNIEAYSDIINPANESVIGTLAMGGETEVNVAVSAAKKAFSLWSKTSKKLRLEVLDRIIVEYKKRLEDLAKAITLEMGAPIGLATQAQAPIGLTHFNTAREALEKYEFETYVSHTKIIKEAAGVCVFITPWNWPMNQIACKVAPALACGCSIVLKPSECAPLSAQIFAEIMDKADLPEGVFNMVHGDGLEVGAKLTAHPDVDVVSLTGSTRAGVAVSKAAADTVKRVALELGGKSANIILDDADLHKAVSEGVIECCSNTGQSCNAPTRMLVPQSLHEQAVRIAKEAAEGIKIGLPDNPETEIGPVSNLAQFSKVQHIIEQAIEQGSELVCGGIGRPDGFISGYFVQPTIFANVKNTMMIAREEVFGPVLAILPYENEEQAIEIANDSPYGLAAYVQAGSIERAQEIAMDLRVGNVFLNGNNYDAYAPFGGYKQSGIGREWSDFAFHDFLEVKGIVGVL